MNKKIIAVCAGLGLLFGCSSNPEFKNREELEDVVEMRLPNYRVKKYYEDTSFDIHGDYSDSLLIEFDNMPSKAFINEVNKKVEQDKDKDNENNAGIRMLNINIVSKRCMEMAEEYRNVGRGKTIGSYAWNFRILRKRL